MRNAHSPTRLGRFLLPVIALVSVLGLAACEEMVSPIIESDRRYTLFATLDMNSDSQLLRVIPIRETIFGDPSELTVEVRSRDLESGMVTTWRDSLVTFSDGLVGHIFVTQLRIEPLHRYVIEVVENGEVVTSAQTTVPALPDAEVFREQIRTTPSGYAGSQRLIWHELLDFPFDITYWYRFYSYRANRFQNVIMPHVPTSARSSSEPTAWDFYVDLSGDRLVLEEEYPRWRADPFAGIGMTITILDDQFKPPGGKFDRQVLSQPGTFSNVQGGFGYVGSVGRFSVEWVLSDSTARVLGFSPLGGALKAELEALSPGAGS